MGFTGKPEGHLRSGCTPGISNPELQLLQERQSWEMSEELRVIVGKISLQLGVRPAGSFRFQSVAHPGDVDLYEYLVVESDDKDAALRSLSEMLMSLANGLEETSNFFVRGLKAGYEVRDEGKKGLTWQLQELRAGEKQLTEGASLVEALKEGHATGTAKLDVFAKVPLFQHSRPRFVEITNVFRLGYLTESAHSIEPITPEVDHLRAVEDGLKTYSGSHPKAMKYVKRLWERSAFLAQRGFDLGWNRRILYAIRPIFQHWAAKLGTITDHIEVLLSMLGSQHKEMQKAALGDLKSVSNLACSWLYLILQRRLTHLLASPPSNHGAIVIYPTIAQAYLIS